MDRKRLTLDNAIFSDRLRQVKSQPGYERRHTPHPARRIQIDDFRQPARSTTTVPSVPKPVARIATPTPTPPPLSPVAHTAHKAKPAIGPLRKPKGHVRAHVPQKSRVLARVGVKPHTPIEASQSAEPEPAASPKRRRPMALYAMAGMLFVIGLVVSLNGFRANRQVAAQVKQLNTSVTAASSKDDNGSHPSTTKPSDADVQSYAVAPNLPRYIDIPKLAVHARIMSMGVTSDNQLKAPGNVYDAGWYNSSAEPGQNGAMLIDGHISNWTTQGVFYGLNKLAAGDKITVTRGDNKQFTYTVVKTATVDAKSVDMSSLLVSADTAKPGLNLISCSGDVIPGSNEFDKRITVYAVQQ